MARASKLGESIINQITSGIGLADATLLLSNCLHSLKNFFRLSLTFCSKDQIQLCVEN